MRNNKKFMRAMITILVVAYVGMETGRMLSLVIDDYYKQLEQIRTGRNRTRRQFNGWDGLLKLNIDL